MRTKNELYQEAMRTVAARRQVARARAEDARAEAEAAIPALRHAEEEVRVRASAAHWPVLRARTAPKLPPPLPMQSRSWPPCWHKADGPLMHWSRALSAPNVRTPAA